MMMMTMMMIPVQNGSSERRIDGSSTPKPHSPSFGGMGGPAKIIVHPTEPDGLQFRKIVVCSNAKMHRRRRRRRNNNG